MHSSPLRSATLLACLASLGATAVAAAPADGTFASEAASMGLSEIQASRLALEKSDSPAVRQFAQHMIDDHAQANRALFELARLHGFDMPDEAALAEKARKMMLQVPEGASFDAAYARHQVNAHQQAIRLFDQQRQAGTAEESIRMYARDTLPMLRDHLERAQQLQHDLPSDTDGARQP
ncbi:DUF4142 domain-containing protein [Pseudomonas sp. Marseille-QA0332]